MRTSTSVLVILLSIVIAMPRVQAQAAHTASQSAIDAALQQHVSSAAADRADLLRVLANPEVKAVADKAGLDLRKATTAVASLEGQQLSQLAAQARQVDQALAGEKPQPDKERYDRVADIFGQSAGCGYERVLNHVRGIDATAQPAVQSQRDHFP